MSITPDYVARETDEIQFQVDTEGKYYWSIWRQRRKPGRKYRSAQPLGWETFCLHTSDDWQLPHLATLEQALDQAGWFLDKHQKPEA
jgi:hypothetical protein